MKTLPERLVDLGVKIGLLPRNLAYTERVSVQLSEEQRTRIASAVRGGIGDYDPDAEFYNLSQKPPTLFDFTATVDPWDRPIGAISAQLYEVDKDGRSYRLQRYETKEALIEAMQRAGERWDELKLEHRVDPPWKLREAKTLERDKYLDHLCQIVLDRSSKMLREGASFDQVRTKLREDFSSDGAYSFSYGSPGFAGQDWVRGPASVYGSGYTSGTEYIPVMGGPWNKQLYLAQFLDMHAKAFEAYNHNPIAHQLINLTTMFTLGRGIDHTCTNIEVDEIIREFVDRTDFYARFEQIATDLWWSGEHIPEWYDNGPEKGLTDFRELDPSTIWEIVTDPEDFRKVYYAHQQYATPWQQYVTGVSNKDQPVTMKYIIRQIPVGQFSHFKINSSAFEKRGRSELFCILGWLKRLKDLMNARVIKGQLEAAFVWDITISTGDADVNSIDLQLPDPYNPGSTFVHNKTLELKPQSSQIKGNEASPDVSTLHSMIATGVSTPKEFIGETMRGARGSAAVLAGTEPGTKRYETKQQLEVRIAYAYFDRVIKNAADAGIIDLEDVLEDARTVKRLATTEEDLEDRDDVKEEFEKNKAEAQATAQAQAEAAQAAGTGLVNVSRPPQDAGPSSNGKAQQPEQDQAPLVNPNRTNGKAKIKEGASLIKSGSPKKLNDAQKRRIQAIIKSGHIARELIELSFPSIAQEERSAKLKDLALSEAMEWLPKSITATIAAKELGISTYDFQEVWAMIVEEAKKGMSLAHVFGQDNKHIPDVAMAQSVQEEEQAMQPPAQQPFINEPTPPAEAGMKMVPNKNAPQPGAPGSVPPGKKPDSGDTKVSNKLAVKPTNPTNPADKTSRTGKSPFTSEGRANAKEVATLKTAVYMTLLKEAVSPLLDIRTMLARYVLDNDDARKQFEEAVSELERIGDDSH